MASTQDWIRAFRLRTLPLALSGIALGTFLAAAAGSFDPAVLFLAIVTTLFLQILSNLANDYGDRDSGADKNRKDRGHISSRQMKKAMMIFGLLALISGIALVLVGTSHLKWYYPAGFIALGLLAIWAAVKYTVGKRPYGYYGFGDLFVFLFFGITGVAGCFFLHTGTITSHVLLPATSAGLLSVAVLNLNNMRDRLSDEKANKRTLAVLLGDKTSRAYHCFLILGAYIAAAAFVVLNWNGPAQLLFLIPLPILVLNMIKVLSFENPQDLDSELKKVAISTLIFSVTFGLGLIA